MLQNKKIKKNERKQKHIDTMILNSQVLTSLITLVLVEHTGKLSNTMKLPKY